jgi:hypothetical protein
MKITATELQDALTYAPPGRTRVPGDYIKLENQWARVTIQASPYDDEPDAYIVSGDTKDGGAEYATQDIVEAYRYALASLALYARGRC